MPLVERSTYTRRPFYLFNGHLETIVPSLLGKVDEVPYERERLELHDGDFLDIDWLRSDSSTLMVISHGLEGSADRYYVKRTARYFHDRGWDVLAWNCRSCSGEMNRKPRFYHHGDTPDLSTVIDHALAGKSYEKVVLFGYSMGGSMSLKYLGEQRERSDVIAGAITFSVPVNLKDSAVQIEKKENRIYEKRFLQKLKEKILLKAEMHPEVVSAEGIEDIRDFDTFHERYTVPLHGFSSIDEFYNTATCDQFLDDIQVPALIANAHNDPMLGEKCYPYEQAARLKNIFLDVPRIGGHVGFTIKKEAHSWMELRAESFLNEVIS
jgi:predicted alpha/beta-fold hydrolase